MLLNVYRVLRLLVHTLLVFNHKFGLVKTQECSILNKVSQVGIFNIIGLFPIRIQHPDELYANGILRSEVMKYVITNYNKQYQRDDLIGYTLYDICGPFEFEVTTDAAMDVVLNNPSSHKNNSERNTCPCIYKNEPLSYTLGIVGPAVSSKSIHISHLMQHEALPIISYGSTSHELSNRELYPNFFRTIQSDKYQARFIKDYLGSFNWTYVSVIASDDSYGRSGMKALKMDNTLCFHLSETWTLEMKTDNIKNIMTTLKNDTLSNVVVLWGSKDLIVSILKYAAQYNVKNKIWLLSEASGRNQWFISDENKLDGTILVVVSSAGRYKEFEEYIFDKTYDNNNKDMWLNEFFQLQGINSTHNNKTNLEKYKDFFELSNLGFVHNAVVTYLDAFTKYFHDSTPCSIRNIACVPPPINDHEKFIEKYIKMTNFKGLLNETIHFNQYGDVKSQYFEIFIAKKKIKSFQLAASWTNGHLEKYQLNNAAVVTTTTSACSDACKPGFYQFGIRKCCWKCVQCPENQTSSKQSQYSCTKCPPKQISNENRTKCILLKLDKIKYKSGKAVAIYVVSSLGMIFTLLVIMTFIVSHETPAIKSSNLIPSLIQLFCHLLLFLLQYLYLEDESLLKCRTRTFATGILFSFIVGITLTKVTHIVKVFRLKYKLNKREIFKMITVECIMIIAAVIIDVCLIVIFMQIKPMEIVKKIDKSNYTEYDVCTVRLHSVGQTIYIIILQIICAVQAFRGRKLPANYNETRYIAFAMFSSSLILVAGIAVGEGMTNTISINFGMSIVTMAANMAILTTLYGYKIYIIWLQPHENNEQAFNRERVDSFNSQHNRRWSEMSVYSLNNKDINVSHINQMSVGDVITNIHRLTGVDFGSAANTPRPNRNDIRDSPAVVITNDYAEDNSGTPIKSYTNDGYDDDRIDQNNSNKNINDDGRLTASPPKLRRKEKQKWGVYVTVL